MTGQPRSRGQLRVLLIEDSALLRQLMQEMFAEIEGVELVGVADGEKAALDTLEKTAADLAIVDLELGEGSGLGVLRSLSEAPDRYGQPRAVVFSSHARESLRRRCSAYGAEAFFDKANGMNELMDFVQAAVASR
ncbi:MAG: response regulator [Rhodocyclaceae bacterium]